MNVDAYGSVSHDCWPGLDCGYSAGRFGSRRTSARDSFVSDSYCALVYSNDEITLLLIRHGTMSRLGPQRPLS